MAFLNSYLFWKYPLVHFYFPSLGKRKSVNAGIKSHYFLALVNKYPYQEKPFDFYNIMKCGIKLWFKKIHTALANVAQLVGATSHTPKGSGFDPWSGWVPKATNVSFSYRYFSLPTLLLL